MLAIHETVLREFGILCLVGTKIATAAFRNGDFIRVDANKGVVEKVKRKKMTPGMQTSVASEASLAKEWLTKEEDDAWAHLQEKKQKK